MESVTRNAVLVLALVFVFSAIVPMSSSAVSPKTPESAAAVFLAANGPDLHARSGELRMLGVVASLSGYHVRYQQTLNGVPVFGAVVNVAVDRGMTTRFAISGAREVTPDASAPVLGPREASLAARARFGTYGYSVSIPSLVYYPDGDVARLAWRVDLDSAARGAWTVFTSAVDGRVVAVLDARRQLSALGLVFDPNPIVTSGDSSLRDQNDQDYPALIAQEMERTLQGLDGSGHLRGPFVSVKSGRGPDAIETDGTYFYPRSDERFEQVMAYFHVDDTQRYIQSLGFTNVNNRAQEVRTNAFSYDNSYYHTVTKTIYLGRGGVDDSEDADVILHEYGHAIQDNQVPDFGLTREGGAMGEGFGDYWAVTNHFDVTPKAWRPLVMIWDATSYDSHDPPYLRRVDLDLHFPEDYQGRVHHDGQIWSRVLWDMRNRFGGVVADTITLEAHFFLTPYSGFEDGANALLMADILLYGGQHVRQIGKFLDDRGIPHM